MRKQIGIFISSNARCMMHPDYPLPGVKTNIRKEKRICSHPTGTEKQIEELYQKHPEEARDSFGNDPFEVKTS